MSTKRFYVPVLLFALAVIGLFCTGCAKQAASADGWADEKPVSRMELQYAQQFSVDFYKDGCRLITISDANRYLVVPEGVAVPQGVPQDIVVLQQPLNRIYLVATSAMDFFCSLDETDTIRLSGTDASGWYLPQAKQALENGTMLYAGKYNAPDYETILENQCDLALESTMIYHNPEVKEQLERLGVPVLVERSSYEPHPLGRMEWVKLYGVLLGKEQQAEALFDRQLQKLSPILAQPGTGKTVAFFYITSTGAVNVRKPGDYISKTIELSGGQYVPSNSAETENALSTMNIQMESFYAAAKDADVLVYNSTIDGELQTMQQLLEKNGLLADFKAVQEGNVWCTGQNLFQETMGLGGLLTDIHTVLTQEAPKNLTYLYRLS